MTAPHPEQSAPVSKRFREACHKDRDAFYQCCRDHGFEFLPDVTPIPDKCKPLRAAFEAGCLSSWVKHFDALQDAQARRSKLLAQAINEKANTAAGSLAGKAQPR